MIRSAFAGKRSASFDMLALNAAAVIYIGGKSKNLEEGVEIAKDFTPKRRSSQSFQQVH